MQLLISAPVTCHLSLLADDVTSCYFDVMTSLDWQLSQKEAMLFFSLMNKNVILHNSINMKSKKYQQEWTCNWFRRYMFSLPQKWDQILWICRWLWKMIDISKCSSMTECHTVDITCTHPNRQKKIIKLWAYCGTTLSEFLCDYKAL